MVEHEAQIAEDPALHVALREHEGACHINYFNGVGGNLVQDRAKYVTRSSAIVRTTRA